MPGQGLPFLPTRHPSPSWKGVFCLPPPLPMPRLPDGQASCGTSHLWRGAFFVSLWACSGWQHITGLTWFCSRCRWKQSVGRRCLYGACRAPPPPLLQPPPPAEEQGCLFLYLLYRQETESPGDGRPRSHSWRAGCQVAGLQCRPLSTPPWPSRTPPPGS